MCRTAIFYPLADEFKAFVGTRILFYGSSSNYT